MEKRVEKRKKKSWKKKTDQILQCLKSKKHINEKCRFLQ